MVKKAKRGNSTSPSDVESAPVRDVAKGGDSMTAPTKVRQHLPLLPVAGHPKMTRQPQVNDVVQYGDRAWQVGFLREFDGADVLIERPTRMIRKPLADLVQLFV